MARRVSVLMAFAGCLLAAGSSAQVPAAALSALDYGDAESARQPLAAAAAESAYWLAVAERGAARRAAAESAAALAPDSLGWIRPAARALVALEDSKPVEATAALREATSLAPGNARLWKQLGDQLRAADDGVGARAAYQRAVDLQSPYPAANLALGDLLRGAGDFGGAFNAYNHALDERENPVGALVARASARLFLGDPEGAASDLERAASRAPAGPDRGRALMGLVYLRAYTRELPQALGRAEAVLAMWSELGRADTVAASANAVGRLLLETGDVEGAASWYERGWRAIEGSSLTPEQRILWRVRYLHAQSRLASQRREADRARLLADEARALMATDAANAEHYAWIAPYLDGYLRLAERRYPEAIAALQGSDLERPYIRYLMAEAYSRNRDRAAARDWYQRALDASTGLDAESVIVRPLATSWLAKNR